MARSKQAPPGSKCKPRPEGFAAIDAFADLDNAQFAATVKKIRAHTAAARAAWGARFKFKGKVRSSVATKIGRIWAATGKRKRGYGWSRRKRGRL